MVEELRWLEYGQRLRHGRRGVLDAPDRAVTLITAATQGGARSLGIAAGKIETGLQADLTLVDLAHPTLGGVPAGQVAGALVYGCGNGPILGTFVAGRFASTDEVEGHLSALAAAPPGH
jgi:formimidoylglutamate deiminase